jgi:hypothetical protein
MWLRKKDNVQGAFGRLLIECQEFDFDVEHVPGKRHYGPDLLSRTHSCPIPDKQENRVATITATSPTSKAKVSKSKLLIGYSTWCEAQNNDSEIALLRDALTTKTGPDRLHKYFRIHNALVCYNGKPNTRDSARNWRVFVPLSLRERLLDLQHAEFGHRGVKPITRILTRLVYWPAMRLSIAKWVRACLSCARRKPPRPVRAGLSGSLISTRTFENLFIDFMHGPLPASDGYIYCLIVVCGFTRYCWALPLKTKDFEEMANALWNGVFSHHGMPATVYSDNELCLVSSAMQFLYKTLGIQRKVITIRHPQGNSIAERLMRYLNSAFTSCLENYTTWTESLDIILFAYRCAAQETTGYSPFSLMYGREPLLPLDVTLMPDPARDETKAAVRKPVARSKHEYVEQMTLKLQRMFIHVRESQDRASRQNALRRDEGRHSPTYEPGQLVMYWDPNDALYSTTCQARPDRPPKVLTETGKWKQMRVPYKWKFTWSGPHTIVKQLHENSYLFFHAKRKTNIPANVDSLRAYIPSDEYPTLVPPPEKPTSKPKEVLIPTAEGPDRELVVNDLLFIGLPNDRTENFAIARYLGTTGDSLLVQWLGNLTNYEDTEDRLSKTKWKNGWFQPKTAQFYWRPKRLHPSHGPYTNENSGDAISRDQVLHSGFGLRPDLKIPRTLCAPLLQIWTHFLAKNDAGIIR